MAWTSFREGSDVRVNLQPYVSQNTSQYFKLTHPMQSGFIKPYNESNYILAIQSSGVTLVANYLPQSLRTQVAYEDARAVFEWTCHPSTASYSSTVNLKRAAVNTCASYLQDCLSLKLQLERANAALQSNIAACQTELEAPLTVSECQYVHPVNTMCGATTGRNSNSFRLAMFTAKNTSRTVDFFGFNVNSRNTAATVKQYDIESTDQANCYFFYFTFTTISSFKISLTPTSGYLTEGGTLSPTFKGDFVNEWVLVNKENGWSLANRLNGNQFYVEDGELKYGSPQKQFNWWTIMFIPDSRPCTGATPFYL